MIPAGLTWKAGLVAVVLAGAGTTVVVAGQDPAPAERPVAVVPAPTDRTSGDSRQERLAGRSPGEVATAGDRTSGGSRQERLAGRPTSRTSGDPFGGLAGAPAARPTVKAVAEPRALRELRAMGKDAAEVAAQLAQGRPPGAKGRSGGSTSGATTTRSGGAPGAKGTSGGTTSAGTGTSGGTTSAGTGATDGATAAPKDGAPDGTVHRVDAVDLRVSSAGRARQVRDAPRLSALPSPARPVAVLAGVLRDRRSVAFTVLPDVTVRGGACRPSRTRCTAVAVGAGRRLDLTDARGRTTRIRVKAVRAVAVHSAAAARKARARESRAGRCLLTALGQLDGAYMASRGTLRWDALPKGCP